MPVEELAHGRRAQKAVDRVGRDTAIARIEAAGRDDQIALRAVVADALEHRAAIDVAAFEGREVDGAAITGFDRLGHDRRGRKLCEQKCQGPDHRC